MARYSVVANRTASLTLAVGGILADATTPRRAKIYELLLGSEATPVDEMFLWRIQRGTTGLGTSSAVAPVALDSGDPAAVTDAGENFTLNPTLPATGILAEVPLHQQATFRWWAPPGGELIVPAAANSSIVITTPTSSAQAVTATILFDE